MDIKDLVIHPKILTFVTTFQCTAACKNCCFGCNPTLKQRLTYEQMKHYTDEAVKYYGKSLKILVLTGGECFLLKEDLNKIIKYANSKELLTRVVTNEYWAKTYNDAYNTLKNLRDCGLNEINFSTGDDHQEWISYDNIVNGCMASMDLGLTCLINVETHDASKFSGITFRQDYRLTTYFDITKYKHPLKIEQGVWIPFDTKTSVSYEKFQNKEDINNRCSSLFNTIPINPYSNVFSCCGLPSEHIRPLRLGNLENKNIQELYESQFKDLLKIWIFLDGPYKVLKFIHNKRGIQKNVFGHICSVCAEIFKDSENIQWIKDHYNEIMPSIMFKYVMLKRTF